MLPELNLLPTQDDIDKKDVEIGRLRDMQEWVSVKDRLPEPKTMCLIFGSDGIQISYFTPNGKFALNALYGTKISHWMPLPASPDGA